MLYFISVSQIHIQTVYVIWLLSFLLLRRALTLIDGTIPIQQKFRSGHFNGVKRLHFSFDERVGECSPSVEGPAPSRLSGITSTRLPNTGSLQNEIFILRGKCGAGEMADW